MFCLYKIECLCLLIPLKESLTLEGLPVMIVYLRSVESSYESERILWTSAWGYVLGVGLCTFILMRLYLHPSIDL